MKSERRKPGPKLPPRQRLLREAQKGLAFSRTKLAWAESKAKPAQDRIRKARADHDEWTRMVAYLEGKTAESILAAPTPPLSSDAAHPPTRPIGRPPLGRQQGYDTCPGLANMARCGNAKAASQSLCSRCRDMELKAGKRS